MKKFYLLLPLLSLLVVGCAKTDPQTSQENSSIESSTQSSQQESSQGGQTSSSELYKATIDNNTPEGYYEPARGLKGPELKAALHEIINDHTHFNYSDTQPFYKDVDRNPHDPNEVNFIYTGPTNVNAGYNKEHVWAKSHGKFENKYPMHSDMHNLHPCNSSLNSSRGNLDFGEGGEILHDYPGENKRGDTFEPSDFSKGDVARTIFYMATRYEGDKGEMDLEVEGNISNQYYDFTSGADGVHGNFDVLYKWATTEIDPVDDFEVSRNNKIFSDYQHNRNPFIDHPEFIQMIYDKNYNGAGALNDNDPHHVLTPQEEAEKFTSLVDAIDETKIEANLPIEEAERYYANMSNEGKELVNDKYQEFLTKKNSYLDMSKSYWANQVIEKIKQLGTITLDSKEAIEACEEAYNKLTDASKALVTNYQTLVDARATYDKLYKEWEDLHPSEPFTFDFTTCEGVGGAYTKNVTLKNGDKSFFATAAFKSGDDFRLGTKYADEAKKSMLTAIKDIQGTSSSLESLFDIMGGTITLTTTKKYGTIDNIYLLKSVDQGATWTLVSSQKYDMEKYVYEFDLTSGKGRYAFVIDGSKARLSISSITVK